MSDGSPPRRPRRNDPLGTRALFSVGDAVDSAADTNGQPGRPGRRDLFSRPDLGARSVVVECRRCGRRTPVGVASLLRRLVPSLWVPTSRFSRYLRCPSCGHFAWCRIDWRAFRPY